MGANDFSEITLITTELKAVRKKIRFWKDGVFFLFLFQDEQGDKSGKTLNVTCIPAVLSVRPSAAPAITLD